MPLTEPYELDNVTVGTGELSIVSGTTSLQTVSNEPGTYQLLIDPVTNMAKADKFVVRIYEKVELTGGTKRVAVEQVIYNIQSQIWIFPNLMLMHGWDMTIQKLAGTDRAFDASIRAITGGLTEAYELDGVSIDGTEISITGGTSSLLTKVESGLYQLWLDPITNLVKSDKFIARIYETVEGTGGVKRLLYTIPIEGLQTELVYSPIFFLKNGWEMTLQRTAGTARAFDASIRKVA
jgi:hypothetical protein